MSEEVSINVSMDRITCGGCGIVFAVPTDWRKEKVAGATKQDRTFYCPNGCCRVYSAGQSEADILRRELERTKQSVAMYAQEVDEERAAHQHTQRQLRGHKAAKTLLKRRVGAGKCPCCSEHFPNLERHMKAAHPDGKVVPIKGRAA